MKPSPVVRLAAALPLATALFLASALAAAPAAAQPVPGASSSPSSFFGSDEAGFRGEALGAAPAEGWYLEVKNDGEGETRILMRDGVEVTRTRIEALPSGRRETTSKGGLAESLDEYDRTGALLLERDFDIDGKTIISERRYSYSAGRLTRVEALDGEGGTTGTMSYRYDARGRLAELTVSGSFGVEGLSTLSGGRGPTALWTGEPLGGQVLVVFYDAMARPLVLESRRADKVTRRETLSYGAASLVSRRVVSLPESKEETETSYDASGRPLSAVTRAAGREVSREAWTYDGKGRVASHEVSSKGRILRETTAWQEDGSSVLKAIQNGVILSVTRSYPDGSETRELYDKGLLFLRSYWAKGRLVKEEFISDGAVSRTKVYP